MNIIDRLLSWLLDERKLSYQYPQCCYCNVLANGRIICAGNDNQVIDNPFCLMHFSEVYKGTIMTIDRKWPGSVKSEFVAIQKWDNDEVVPDMFETEAELLAKGTRRQREDISV